MAEVAEMQNTIRSPIRSSSHRVVFERASLTRLGPLSPQELQAIADRAQSVSPALRVIQTAMNEIDGLRIRLQSFFSRQIKTFPGRRSFNQNSNAVGVSDPNTLEQHISASMTEQKRVVEKVIVPQLNVIRNEYRGRTFVKTKDTPEALMYVSVPSHKLGAIVSFDVLRESIRASYPKQFVRPPRKVSDEGRIRLIRKSGNKTELLELAYERPGRVSVYVDGKRIGKMWTDDAQKTAEAFIKGKEMKFRRPSKPASYTIC